MNLVLLPIAEHDLLDGIDWFDQISIGLGDRFESEFYACIERIQENPNQFAANSTGYRAVRLKRFTAVIFFASTVILVSLCAC